MWNAYGLSKKSRNLVHRILMAIYDKRFYKKKAKNLLQPTEWSKEPMRSGKKKQMTDDTK